MSPKTCFATLIACCFALGVSTASAWSVYDTVQLFTDDDRRCEVLIASGDDQSASEGENYEEEEPDCE